ncbi:MAG: hypothetical protein M5U28_39215 [Sandaracinaceae bacterium]|nr:hypothetical protein [Sandaracinaceae bacterium]
MLVEEVDGRVGDAARALEAGEEQIDHLVGRERVRELRAQLRDHALEIVALAEEDERDLSLEVRAHRIDEEEEDERGDHRVEEEVAGVEEDEHPEDPGQRERERRQQREAGRELVEVEQAVAQDRLREHVEEHQDEHRADGRDVEARVRQVLGQREHGRERPDHGEVGQAGPLEARAGEPARAKQHHQRRREQHEDVGEDERREDGVVVERREDGRDHHEREEERPALELLGAPRLRLQERPEELHRREREEHGADEVQAIPEEASAEEAGQERGQVPRADGGAEETEEPVHAALARAQEHRRGDREGEHRGEQRGLGPEIHARRSA